MKKQTLEWVVFALIAIPVAGVAASWLFMRSDGDGGGDATVQRDALFKKLADPEQKLAAIREAGEKGMDDAVIVLAGMLKDKDHPEVRLEAVRSLGRIGSPRKLDVMLLVLTGDPVGEVRVAAATAIGRVGDPRSIAPLALALEEEPDAKVRAAIVGALAGFEEPEAAEALAGALDDESEPVRDAAREALVGRSAAIPIMRKMVRKGELSPRVELVGTVESIGGPEAATLLVNLLHADEEALKRPEVRAVRHAAVDALAGMGNTAVDALAKGAVGAYRDYPLKKAAGEVLRRVATPRAEEVIVARVMAWKFFPDPEELKLWVRILGEIGTEKSLPAIRRAATQPHEGIEEVAAEAKATLQKRLRDE